jgi:hypothetical protein
MFKKRYFSAHHDFKTGFLCKLTLFLGFFFLFVFIFLKITSIVISKESTGLIRQLYDLSQSGVPDSIIAISIIFLAVGFILYYFHCQFAKLSKIADEIEKSEEFKKSK